MYEEFNFEKYPSVYVELAKQRYAELSKQYRCLPTPFRYIHVDPNAIALRTTIHNEAIQRFGSKIYDVCSVRDGDWDISKGHGTILHFDLLYNAVYSRYFLGARWEDTGLIEAKLQVIRSKGCVDNCRNREELLSRYRRLDMAFDDIRQNGFKRQDQLPNGRFHDELFVTITRFGTPLLASGGNHRLAIARLLKLPFIPCLVMTRHLKWQLVKERYYCARYLGVRDTEMPPIDVIGSIIERSCDPPTWP